LCESGAPALAEPLRARRMGWRTSVARLLAVGLVAFALLRVELVTGFGKGSGERKVHVSPLAVSTHFAMQHTKRLPPGAAQMVYEKFITALALPGEWAQLNGLMPDLQAKKSKSKASQQGVEARAREWVLAQMKNKSMAKFVEENTFLVAGALILLFSMLLAPLFPYEALQNVALGLGCFWFGANGAHGSDARFTYEFFGLAITVALALFLLAEPTKPKDSKAKEAKEADADFKENKVGEPCAPKKKKGDDWDDGIGGVTMDDIRKRAAAGGGHGHGSGGADTCCD
jgi:hypothetical protein